MKKILSTSLLLLLIAIVLKAQVSITVNVATAGSFSSALTAAGGDKNLVTDLTVTGNIDATDFFFFRDNMPLLSRLYLGSAKIQKYSSYPEDGIPSSAFCNSSYQGKTTLTVIELPTNLKSIGYDAFYNCTGLNCSLNIPNTVTSIGSRAFWNCSSLSGSLVLPNSITSIENYTFWGCSGFSGDFQIPPSVTSIGECAFTDCSGLSGNLIIPNTVISLGKSAFSGCSGFNGTLTISTSLTTLNEGVFMNCSGVSGNLNVPTSITSIGSYAFYNCSTLTGKLIIPPSVTSIGLSAFSRCKGLTGDLVIPNTVTTLGNSAFEYCSGFTGTLTISGSLSKIEDYTFFQCTGLTGSLVIPNSIKSIGDYAFSGCSSFTGNLNIPNSVTSIGKQAFMGCLNLTGTLNIPNSVTTIKEWTFYNCPGFTGSLTIPASVVSIEQFAFYCSNIKDTLTIPSSVTTIADNSLILNSGLLKIKVAKVVPVTIYSNTFGISLNKTTCKLVVPLGSKAAYQAANYWKDFADISEAVFVSFNSQGGNAVADMTTTENSKINAPTTPIKKGYTFAGWYKESTCENLWNFDTDVITGSTTLYAKWTINSYTVKFNSNGGNTINDISTIYNTLVSAPTAPERKGYTFSGWYKELALYYPWFFAGDKVTDNITLYAKWLINSYTVKFNVNGGSAVSDKVTNFNTMITCPTNPVRTGYTFAAWYKEPAFTNEWVFAKDSVTENTNLYAKWIINTYDITFNSQEGSAVTAIRSDYSTKISAPTEPTRTGYTFAGWFKENTCANAWNFAIDSIVSNTTLYAKWNINKYTISFNSQGGSAVSEITANYNSTFNSPVAPTKTGYTFVAWYKEADCINAWNFATDVITDNLTLYAKWTINSYTVTFDSKGGTAISEIVTNYNTSIAEPVNPVKEKTEFAGWYKEAAYNNKWNFATDVVTTNMTLHAKWVNNVTFNSQDGSIVSSLIALHDSTISHPLEPSKEGYTFNGWFKEAACINEWNFSSNTIISDTTLYAKWIIQVSFNSQGGSTISPYEVAKDSKIEAPADPTKTGYTFNGWYKESDCTNKWDFSNDLVTASTTLYAKWTINNYTVTFNSQGGSEVTSTKVDYNSIITKPADPTKTGYSFEGWYKEVACNNAWDFDTAEVRSNTTLYAKWKISSSIVSEEKNLHVFPNPFNNNIIVEGENIREITFVTENGMVIKKLASKEDLNHIDLSNFKPGVYFIKIKSENSSKIFKMLKK